MNRKATDGRRRKLVNLGFAVLCGAILAILYLAPEETTSPLPRDSTHLRFHEIASKKEAEKGCFACHGEDGEAVLPEDHPPPYRCLFCHKRDT